MITVRRRGTDGTVLLMCISLVSAASMVAFGFAMSVRGSQMAARNAVAGDLARAAAQMGARHAMEVAVRDLNGSRPGATGEWPFLAQFGHPDRDLVDAAQKPLNNAPGGSLLDPGAAPANGDDLPRYNVVNAYDQTGNAVSVESRLYVVHHDFFARFGQSYGVGDPQDESKSAYWPFPSFPDYSRICSLLNPGNPRWVEPGRFNWDLFATRAPFVRTSDTPATDVNGPVYYDERWMPVSDLSKVRYRTRYAVMALDLGGNFTWGRQLDFGAASPFVAMTGAPPTKNPNEWDETTARGYLPCLSAILSRGDVAEVDGYKERWRRYTALTAFLGRGSSVAWRDGSAQDEKYSGRPASQLMRATGTSLQSVPDFAIAQDVPLYVNNATASKEMLSPVAAIGTGGPHSWQAAKNTVGIYGDAGWWSMWTCSPFGRGNALVESGAPATAALQGRTDCPWKINPLSAPPETIRLMLSGYIPAVAFTRVTQSVSVYHWSGFVADGTNPWSGATPTWQATPDPALSITYNPWGPGQSYPPSHDVLSKTFHPRSMRVAYAAPLAARAGQRLFGEFDPPDLSVAVGPTTFLHAYPGPPEDWEDYHYMQTNYPKGTLAWLGSSPDPDQDLYRCMLGARSLVYHYPFDNYHDPGNTIGGLGKWDGSQLSRSAIGGNADEYYRTISIFSGRGWLSLPGTTGSNKWKGRPFEPMLGSSAFLTRDYKWSGGYATTGGDKVESSGGDTAERRFYHRDSYWLDLLYALGGSLTFAKATWQDATCVGPAAVVDCTTASNYPADHSLRPRTVRDLDARFLAILGEWHPRTPLAVGSPQAPGSTTVPPQTAIAVFQTTYNDTDSLIEWGSRSKRRLIDYPLPGLPSGNILTIRNFQRTITLPQYDGAGNVTSFAINTDQADRRGANMERVLNDMRMSFFGANPRYSGYMPSEAKPPGYNAELDEFRPLDFDGDGKVVCSAYSGTVTIGGKSFPGANAVASGRGPEPDLWFSLTGYFDFDRARFVRVLCRGEVYDQLRRNVVASADLDTTFTVDPDGDNALGDSATLYQRWVPNYYTGQMTHARE